MPGGSLLMLDLAVRSGACVLLGLTAALLLRDYGRVPAARLGALLVLSAVAYAVSSAPGCAAAIGPWAWPLIGAATGVNLLFWLFARSLFDDGFRPSWPYAMLWALIVGLGFVQAVAGDLGPPALAGALGTARAVQAMGFALAAAFQTLSSWPADLVEPRRRLRVFVIAASAAHTLITVTAAVAARGHPGGGVRLGDAAALAAIGLVVAWSLLRVDGQGVLGVVGGVRSAAAPGPELAAELESADHRLLEDLRRLMEIERLYRQDRLSIGALAHRLGTPEYRLRRLINQGLGERNFNAFLNRYRIAEATAALADPAQAEVPVLTIALDSGFASLGPFNRAFKAATGATPTEHRRRALAEFAGSDPAGRVRKSA